MLRNLLTKLIAENCPLFNCDLAPALAWIEAPDGSNEFRRVGPEVRLIYDLVVADHERLVARGPVFCRPGNHGETTDQPAIGKIGI